jgi:prepilin peptidase CpaA
MEPGMFIGLIGAFPLLMAMAYCDLRHMVIPKWVSAGLIGIFVIAALTIVPWAESGIRLAVAAVVFLCGFAAFALRLLGGGDVKALSALMLLIPSAALSHFMLAFAACLVLGVGGVLVVRQIYGRADAQWVFLREKTFPMGISIAGAGMILPLAAALL